MDTIAETSPDTDIARGHLPAQRPRGGGGGLPADYSSMDALPIYRASDLAYLVAWYL